MDPEQQWRQGDDETQDQERQLMSDRYGPVEQESFEFRPLTHADLPRLHGWLSQPHVARWFGESSLADVEEEYGGYIDGA